MMGPGVGIMNGLSGQIGGGYKRRGGGQGRAVVVTGTRCSLPGVIL